MSPFRSEQGQSDRAQKQQAKTQSGNITQVGRDSTQATNTRISLWISVVFVMVFAVAASVFISLFGESIPSIDVRVEEPVPAELPAQWPHEEGDRP